MVVNLVCQCRDRISFDRRVTAAADNKLSPIDDSRLQQVQLIQSRLFLLQLSRSCKLFDSANLGTHFANGARQIMIVSNVINQTAFGTWKNPVVVFGFVFECLDPEECHTEK